MVFCRDDAPDSFSYDIAKALDQHKDLLKWKVLPFSYNTHRGERKGRPAGSRRGALLPRGRIHQIMPVFTART